MNERIIKTGDCPSERALAEFAVGDVSARRLVRIAAHLEGCEGCDARLAELEREEDELVSQLRHISERPEVQEVLPDALLVSARAALFVRAGQEAPELVLDQGRRLAQALADGPRRVGKFLLIEELGSGASGWVFKAQDDELARTVAIKVQRTPVEDAEEKLRFQREARSAAQLEHPGIVSLYEVGETEEGATYLVEEFIDGETLEAHLKRGRPAFRESALIVAEIAEALHAAHERGVVHRDVKPSNVLIDLAGHTHVTDFGLAKRDSGEATATPEHALLGTPAYMSPELARGDAHAADGRSDLFSLGVVLYELLTGERPFQGIRRMLLLQVLEEDPRPPRKLDEAIPRDLETIALVAMAKSPARRFQSAAELAADLRRFLGGEPIRARALGPLERVLRWCRRNPLAASVLAALTFGAAFGLWHLSRLSSELVRRSAVDSAAHYAEMLELVNDVYSTEVVERVGHHGVEATADYAGEAGAIPLPATLLGVLLERLEQSPSGMRGRHYSEHPFRGRADGGPHDGFERDALRVLGERPDEPYYRFVDDAHGRPALLYATARVMKPACVACHNSHPDSTRRDWQVGDVRGVLKIERPLERDIARTRDGLRGSFLMVGAVAFALLGLFLVGQLIGRRRGRLEERA